MKPALVFHHCHFPIAKDKHLEMDGLDFMHMFFNNNNWLLLFLLVQWNMGGQILESRNVLN